MCHSDWVAQSNYLRDDLTAIGAEANDIIAMCTNQTPVSSKQTSLEEDPLNIEEPQEDPGNIKSDNEKDSNTQPLTALQKAEIKCLFQQEIVDNVVIQPSNKLAVPSLQRRGSLSHVHIYCYRRDRL